MRLAVLYDIHANLPALEAVVEEARAAGVEGLIFGGDVLPGPMPRETLDYVKALPIPARYIHGNGDRNILQILRGEDSDRIPDAFKESLRWNAAQLHHADEGWLASWPSTLTMTVPSLGEIFFCHATARNDTEIFTRLTPDERVAEMFAGIAASLVVCGHTHIASDRSIKALRIVNPGSVGMPFGDPGAYWMLLDSGGGVSFQRTIYDLEDAARRIRATAYPAAEAFAASNVLHPPSEAQMLAAFSEPR
jgi:predicted phosphodiesterase